MDDMQNLELLPEEVLKEILLLEEHEQRLKTRAEAHDKFMPYAKHVYDGFIEGTHHRVIAEKLEKIARGELKRLIVNMPPRHSKSEFASYLMPSWFLGRNPKLKIIQATMNTELAVRFGRKVRDLIADPIYREIFPNTDLKQDSQAAGRWETSVGGEYFAAGVGAAMTGRGADLLIIDDPHSEQTAMSNTGFDDAWDWYTGGPRQRLQPGGSIVIVQTRWSEKDMTGQLLRAMAKDPLADQWEVVELPAIFEDGTPCWPEYWSLEDL
ncbi:MAG TPA: terminase, partial [Rhodobacteraceae bacterium]|nr:terminase [Paracoccaceae bacterium]